MKTLEQEINRQLSAKVFVPPIKNQGIKTKLAPRIRQVVQWEENGRWIEPFMGTGVVGFNIRPKQAIFADSNPHIINFYQAINTAEITPAIVRAYLENDGMIRFNQKGGFNVPFNHKPNRFSQAYTTKIVNQVQYVFDLCRLNEYTFVCQDFRDTFRLVQAGDFVYCDPPYAGRHVDYFNSWDAQDEDDLFELLADCEGRFILSTWHSNQHRSNSAIPRLEEAYHVITHEHFYHVGAKETNRKPVLEALVLNYQPTTYDLAKTGQYRQAALLESKAAYQQYEE